jgi:hypothetical protein
MGTERIPSPSVGIVRGIALGIALCVVPGVLLTSLACVARGTDAPSIEVVGPAPARMRESPLRIATANLWGVSVLGFEWADAIDERFAEISERLAENAPDLDVVLIQEAWKDSARRALLDHAGVSNRFPYRVDVVDRPGGAGLVVLSRLPIESAHFHRFRDQGNCWKFWEGDCIAGKGILIVRARLGERLVWIGTTHFIACYARDETNEVKCDEDDPNGLTRWNQLSEMNRVIEGLVGDDPILIGGDFNFTRASRYYASMTDAQNRWTEPGEASEGDDRIDFLWTRPGSGLRWHATQHLQPIFESPVRLKSGESVRISDHPILAAEFCLVGMDDNETRCDPETAAGPEPTLKH